MSTGKLSGNETLNLIRLRQECVKVTADLMEAYHLMTVRGPSDELLQRAFEKRKRLDEIYFDLDVLLGFARKSAGFQTAVNR